MGHLQNCPATKLISKHTKPSGRNIDSLRSEHMPNVMYVQYNPLLRYSLYTQAELHKHYDIHTSLYLDIVPCNMQYDTNTAISQATLLR